MRLKSFIHGAFGALLAVAFMPQTSPAAHAEGPRPLPGPKKPGAGKPTPKPRTVRFAIPPTSVARPATASAEANARLLASRANAGRNMTAPTTSARGNSNRWSTQAVGPTPSTSARPPGSTRPPPPGKRWSTQTMGKAQNNRVRGTKTVTKGSGSGQGKSKSLKTAKPAPPASANAGSRASQVSEALPRARRNNRQSVSGAPFTLPNATAANAMVTGTLARSRPIFATQPPPPAGAPPPLPSGPPPAAPRQTLQVPIGKKPRNIKSARPPGGSR